MPRRAGAPRDIVERMRGYARAAGRDPADIGIEGRVYVAGRTPEDWRDEYRAWQALGATHMQVYTMDGGLAPDGHIDAIRRVKEALDGL